MKVAIVDCLGAGSKGRRLATLDVIGVGPRLVAGILEALNIDYDYYVCSEVLEDPKMLDDVDAVLVSGMSVDLPSTVRLAKSLGRDMIKIVGGPICVEYQELLRVGYDFVVWGEAEDKLPILLKTINEGLASPNVAGVLSLRNGKILGVVPENKYVSYDLLHMYKPSTKVVKEYPNWWSARVYVEVVRGCSNFYRTTLKLPDGRECTGCNLCRSGELDLRITCPAGIPPGCGYCLVPRLFGPARSRPVDVIVDEVRELIGLGVKRVVLSAPDFLDFGRDWLVYPKPLTDPRTPKANLKALNDLLERISNISEIASGEAYVMIENVKPNLVTEEVAKLLGNYLSGSPVGVGLESGDSRLHKALGRPSTVGEVFKAVKLLCRYGLRPHLYLMHGLPSENEETIRKTAEVVIRLSKLDLEKVTLYRFTPLKYTAFEGFPRPKPAIKGRYASKLYKLIRRVNTELKKKSLGRIVKAIVAGYRGRYLVAYPLPHGPVTLINGPRSLIRKVVYVRYVKVLNDREVLGELMSAT